MGPPRPFIPKKTLLDIALLGVLLYMYTKKRTVTFLVLYDHLADIETRTAAASSPLFP